MSWLSHSRKGDCYAYCKVCNKVFRAQRGLKDIKRHGSTESHIGLAKSNVGQQTLSKTWSNGSALST